jgi:hypothetical protein
MGDYAAARAPKPENVTPPPKPTVETRAGQPAQRKNREPVQVIEGG